MNIIESMIDAARRRGGNVIMATDDTIAQEAAVFLGVRNAMTPKPGADTVQAIAAHSEWTWMVTRSMHPSDPGWCVFGIPFRAMSEEKAREFFLQDAGRILAVEDVITNEPNN